MSEPNGSADNGGMIHKTACDASAPAVQVRFRCEVVATTREGVIEQLAEILGVEGYYVSKKVAWEKVGAYRKRIGLGHRMFHHLLKHPACPPVELLHGSGRKQVLALNPNPVFEAFVVAVKGKRPAPRDPNAPPRRKHKTIAEGRPSRRKPDHLLKRPRYRKYQEPATP